jgi:MFS transporter, DHA3 family, macrolide efflux protein
MLAVAAREPGHGAGRTGASRDGDERMTTYLIIILGQLVSSLGSRLTDFGLGVWIYQRTGSATQFAVSVLVGSLPRIVLAPVIGALVDRLDRRRVMLASDTLLALKTCVILALVMTNRLAVWQVYLLNAVGSVFESSHGLSWSASVSLLVPKRHLARVNGLNGALNSGMGILAPALAGVLYVLIGMRGITLVDLGTWAFAVGPLLFVAIPQPQRAAGGKDRPGLLGEIREGWAYLRGARGLFSLLIAYTLINFFGITTDVLHGPYVLSFNGPERYGIVESVVSVGSLAGGLLLTALGNPRRVIWLILGAEAVIALCGAVMGAVPSFVVVAAAVFVYYAAVSFCDGSIEALWQRAVPPGIQGRVFALKSTLNMSLMPVGILLFSPLAEYWLEPRLAVGGQWAGSVGAVVGTGAGRGIGLLFVATGMVNLAIIALALGNRGIRRVDAEVPD